MQAKNEFDRHQRDAIKAVCWRLHSTKNAIVRIAAEHNHVDLEEARALIDSAFKRLYQHADFSPLREDQP